MKLYPALPEEAFIQVGDFIGIGVKHCARRGAARAIVVGMMGKLSKMANGKMQTHAAGSEVNMELLAALAAELGADARRRRRDPRRQHRAPRARALPARGARRHHLARLPARQRATAAPTPAARSTCTRASSTSTEPYSGAGHEQQNDMRQMTALGRSIEDGSFAIIDAEAGAHGFDARGVAGGAARDPRHRRLRVHVADAAVARRRRRRDRGPARRLPGGRATSR